MADIKRQIGVVRRMRAKVSRGPFLSEITKALVIGKLQTCAWITRQARISSDQSHANLSVPKSEAEVQVIINDLARVLFGKRRADQERVSDLLDKTSLPTMNEVVVRQSAMAAWKSQRDQNGPLGAILKPFDSRTRGSSLELRRPISVNSVAALNMASAWNACCQLREATNSSQAKKAAKQLATASRMM